MHDSHHSSTRVEIAERFLSHLATDTSTLSPVQTQHSTHRSRLSSLSNYHSIGPRLEIANVFLSTLAGNLIRDPTFQSGLSAVESHTPDTSFSPSDLSMHSSELSPILLSPQRSLESATLVKTRVFLTTGSMSAPSMIFSCIPLSGSKPVLTPLDEMNMKSKRASTRFKIEEEKSMSYAELLQSDWQSDDYDPYELDDPELTTGRHRTVMNLPGLLGSVISFTTEKELRDELNHQFYLRHPWIDKSMSLTKIRKIKWLYTQCIEFGVDWASVGYAVVYFERLVLQKEVDKQNRKLIAAVCLMLAVKFNEFHDEEYFQQIFEGICTTFGVKKEDMFACEFEVAVNLKLDLYVDPAIVLTHLRRLIQTDDVPFEDEIREALATAVL